MERAQSTGHLPGHAPGKAPEPPVADPGSSIRSLPTALQRDLRSDHAGETGAVGIYRGILAVSRDPEVRDFASAHLATERRHLAWFEAELPRELRTRLRRLCFLAGWLTGALPALFGPRPVFATIEAVERFVDGHYGAQIDALEVPRFAPLRAVLASFRDDEIDHQHDAAGRVAAWDRPVLLRAWVWLVGAGSAVGVFVARRI